MAELTAAGMLYVYVIVAIALLVGGVACLCMGIASAYRRLRGERPEWGHSRTLVDRPPPTPGERQALIAEIERNNERIEAERQDP